MDSEQSVDHLGDGVTAQGSPQPVSGDQALSSVLITESAHGTTLGG